MEVLKRMIKQVRWWEWLYVAVVLTTIIVLGIVLKSSWIVLCNSIVLTLTLCCVAKGFFVANIIGIASSCLYATMSILNQYYGEAIFTLVVSLPCYCFSLYTWLKNRDKKVEVVKVNSKISCREWILIFVLATVIGFGGYWILKILGTAKLVVSTISMVVSGVAGYLQVRRSEFNFIGYIASNILGFTLWLLVALEGDLTQILTLVCYVSNLTINIFGFANWIRIKKSQSAGEDEAISCKRILSIIKTSI